MNAAGEIGARIAARAAAGEVLSEVGMLCVHDLRESRF
jgi:hypothetical protein